MVAVLAVAAAGAVAAGDVAVAGRTAELLRFAPEGTWAAGAVDLERLLAAPMLAPLPMMAPDIARQARGIRTAAAFALPMEPPLDEHEGPRRVCGLVELAEGKRGALETELTGARQDEPLEGLAVYGGPDLLAAFVDDTTLVFGSDRDALAAAVRVVRAGAGAGLTGGLKAITEPHAGRTLFGGMALPRPLAEGFPESAREDSPEWIRELTGAGFGCDLAPNLAARVHLKFLNPDAAQAVRGAAQERIAALRTELAAQGDPAMAAVRASAAMVLDAIELTAEGPDFRASIDLNPQQTQALQGALFMQMMMFGQSLGRARAQAQTAVGMANLRNLFTSMVLYRADHQQQFPPSLKALLDEGYLTDRDMLIDPADPAPQVDPQSGLPTSYLYAGEVPPNVPGNFIIAYSRKGIYGDVRFVLYADGAVSEVSEADLQRSGAARGMSFWDCFRWAADHWRSEFVYEDEERLRRFFEIQG